DKQPRVICAVRRRCLLTPRTIPKHARESPCGDENPPWPKCGHAKHQIRSRLRKSFPAEEPPSDKLQKGRSGWAWDWVLFLLLGTMHESQLFVRPNGRRHHHLFGNRLGRGGNLLRGPISQRKRHRFGLGQCQGMERLARPRRYLVPHGRLLCRENIQYSAVRL